MVQKGIRYLFGTPGMVQKVSDTFPAPPGWFERYPIPFRHPLRDGPKRHCKDADTCEEPVVPSKIDSKSRVPFVSGGAARLPFLGRESHSHPTVAMGKPKGIRSTSRAGSAGGGGVFGRGFRLFLFT